MTKTKKKIRIVVLILAIVAGLILAGVIAANVFLHRKTLISEDSHGALVVRVYTVGDPDFPFGASHCRIVLKEGTRKIASEDVDVLNDGGRATADDFAFDWKEDSLEVTVSGEEMEAFTVTLPCSD